MPNTSAANSHAHTTQAPSPAAVQTPSTPVVALAAPAPRARGQNARKRAAQTDDAAYHAAIGTKRSAGDRAEGDRERTKRKRVDASTSGAGGGTQSTSGGAANAGDKDEHVSLIDFTTLPTDALHRYLAHFDLIPDLDPSPLSVEDPGPPASLLKPKSHVPPHGHALRRTSTASPGPTGTSTNRPRRDPAANRRRSSRLVEDERTPAPPPVYSDLAEVDGVLAAIAERHFREQEVKEVDTLAAFMCAVQAKARLAAS